MKEESKVVSVKSQVVVADHGACHDVDVLRRNRTCQLTCKPALDERDWGAFFTVGALPPFPPFPPLPPLPDWEEEVMISRNQNVR